MLENSNREREIEQSKLTKTSNLQTTNTKEITNIESEGEIVNPSEYYKE
jgi:hypothetical protein